MTRQMRTVSIHAMRDSDTAISCRLRRRVASAGRTSVDAVNRRELIDRVALAAELPRGAAARALEAALAVIEASLRAGEPVSLRGFGSFHVARYTGRAGVNPRTGERIVVATTPVPRFRPGSRLRRRCVERGGFARGSRTRSRGASRRSCSGSIPTPRACGRRPLRRRARAASRPSARRPPSSSTAGC